MMSSSSSQQQSNILWVDPKTNVAHYNGDPKRAEECEESDFALSDNIQRGQAGLCCQIEECTSWKSLGPMSPPGRDQCGKLLTLSEAEPSATAGALVAVKLVVKTVRAA